MINILIPLGGKSPLFDESTYPFPKPLIEINGKPMIERVLNDYLKIRSPKKFIFVLKSEDCDKYHLDKVLNLLADNACQIIRLSGETKGAACSALMAIEHINTDEELIISNGDQVIEEDFNNVLKTFRDKNADGGVICFESVHPKFSYARLDQNSRIIETAEKSPISKNAIAGFYYYKHGRLFVESAIAMIEHDVNVNGNYYISPTYNELVLGGSNLQVHQIAPAQYHLFYSPQKIKEYESTHHLAQHHPNLDYGQKKSAAASQQPKKKAGKKKLIEKQNIHKIKKIR
jgi:dTDP-glucose pyrophosphorylase